MQPKRAWRGVIAGTVAGCALVAALAAGVVPGGLALAAAIAERLRGLLPLQVLGFLIVRLKFAAKPLGLWVSLATVVLVCAALGGASAAWRPRSLWVTGVIAAGVVSLGLAAAAAPSALQYLSASLGAQGVANSEAQALRMVVIAVMAYGVLAAAVFVAVLWAVSRSRQLDARPVGMGGAGTGVRRRQFLARAVVGAGAVTGAATAVRWLGAMAAQAAAAAQTIFQRIKGLPPEVTPNDAFYTVSKNPGGLDPRLDARKWALEITGLVERPVKLTYDDIKAMPSVTRYHTLECISNEVGGDLIGNALWKGVRFRDLIGRAGMVSPTAIRFALRCADGYSEGIPVADAMKPDVMLAYEMNGVPLPPSHGFPLRMLTPGIFGMKNPKWLTKIEAVSTTFTGYWQASGWSDEAVVKTMSAFRVPGGRDVPSGDVSLGGVAFSGDRGIRDVEVSADNGKTWFKAEVKSPLGPYTWLLWAAIWKPAGPGEYILKVRARDGQGVVQTAQEAPTLPDGASGYHTMRIRVQR